MIIYDRRAHGRSSATLPIHFSVAQQSQDAVAILEHLRIDSAFVFGNSAGAVITLGLATHYPHKVKAALLHEPPLVEFSSEAQKWKKFFSRVYRLGTSVSPFLGNLYFLFRARLPFLSLMKAVKNFEDVKKTHAAEYKNSEAAGDVALKHELLPIVNYQVDIPRILASKVKVFAGAGVESVAGKRFYAQTAQNLAKALGTEFVALPGNHFSLFEYREECRKIFAALFK